MSAEKLDMDALQLKWWARKRSCLFGETFSSLEGEFPPDMEANKVQISTKQPALRRVENGFKRRWDIIDLSNANWKVSANKEQMLFPQILPSNADVAAKSPDDPILWYRGRFYFNSNPIFSSTQWNRISTISSQFARKIWKRLNNAGIKDISINNNNTDMLTEPIQRYTVCAVKKALTQKSIITAGY